jgi:hypothetical protein
MPPGGFTEPRRATIAKKTGAGLEVVSLVVGSLYADIFEISRKVV